MSQIAFYSQPGLKPTMVGRERETDREPAVSVVAVPLNEVGTRVSPVDELIPPEAFAAACGVGSAVSLGVMDAKWKIVGEQVTTGETRVVTRFNFSDLFERRLRLWDNRVAVACWNTRAELDGRPIPSAHGTMLLLSWAARTQPLDHRPILRCVLTTSQYPQGEAWLASFLLVGDREKILMMYPRILNGTSMTIEEKVYKLWGYANIRNGDVLPLAGGVLMYPLVSNGQIVRYLFRPFLAQPTMEAPKDTTLESLAPFPFDRPNVNYSWQYGRRVIPFKKHRA